jgi:predicted nuclease with TOPRIM domain
MSDELHAEIARLRAENKKLAGDVASLAEELRDVRAEARDRRHENKGLAQQVADLTKDRDGWKQKVEAEPHELQTKLGEVTTRLRDVTHRRAFETVAARLKVTDPTRQSDLWALTGYTPDTDEVDEKKITRVIQDALKGRPWLADAEAGASMIVPGGTHGAKFATEGAGRPGPGADRGQSITSGTGATSRRTPGRL